MSRESVTALFCGGVSILQPEGQQSGISKHAVERFEVNALGAVGDVQVDRRFHGGPEKALHQYGLPSYQAIVQAYPELMGIAVPGSMGENIASPDMRDEHVCIGDIYRMGDVLLQVAQPRKPCWKINRRFDVDTLSQFVEKSAITGWYYRVLEPGHIASGDAIDLLERPNPGGSVARFVAITKQHRPTLDDLDALIHCEALSPDYKNRLANRRRFLADQA